MSQGGDSTCRAWLAGERGARGKGNMEYMHV